VEVHLKPETQAELARWTAETGRSAEELVEEAMAGYFDELAQVRGTLDSRYDELKSGRVPPIEGPEALARLREKSKAHRADRRG